MGGDYIPLASPLIPSTPLTVVEEAAGGGGGARVRGSGGGLFGTAGTHAPAVLWLATLRRELKDK